MPRTKKLTSHIKLSPEHKEFLEAWQIPIVSTFLPSTKDKNRVHIWSSEPSIFEQSDTALVIGCRVGAIITKNRGSLFVGSYTQGDLDFAEAIGIEPLDLIAYSATMPVIGLKRALTKLNKVSGYPDNYQPANPIKELVQVVRHPLTTPSR